MSDQEKQGQYLAGESDGSELNADERAVLDRLGRHLSDQGMWEPPALDGQFRLLAAAAEESRQRIEGDDHIDLVDPDEAAAPVVRPLPRAVPPINAEGDPVSTAGSGQGVTDAGDGPGDDSGSVVRLADGAVDDDADNVIRMPDRRRAGRAGRGGRASRVGWFGAGAVVAAAAAAIAVVATGRLDTPTEPTIDSELAVTATYELQATPLDPDVEATIDVVPTVAGVEFWLHIKGLDNAEGGDYYSAWLVGADETVPLGSFHWRKGGISIILWSGVDDPAYDRFMVTRQTIGDGGRPSDEVVLMGMLPDLIGE